MYIHTYYIYMYIYTYYTYIYIYIYREREREMSSTNKSMHRNCQIQNLTAWSIMRHDEARSVRLGGATCPTLLV